MNQSQLIIQLHQPGLTPMLQSGLGGLATALRWLAKDTWPHCVSLGPGQAIIEPKRIIFHWNGEARATLRALFDQSFLIRNGLIHLPSVFQDDRLELSASFQSATKKTFLQHGSTTTKAGAVQQHAFRRGEREVELSYQPYSAFAHQWGWEKVVEALQKGTTRIASWVHPGAITQHIGWSHDTTWAYTAQEALCALFTIIGCLSLEVAQAGGGLLILVPDNLIQFAEVRPLLTPARLEDAYVASTGDAMLRARLAIQARPGISDVHGITFQSTPWSTQQKSRTETIASSRISAAVLQNYARLIDRLPLNILLVSSKKKPANYFTIPSVLRGFITDNLVRGRRWYQGFATATTDEKIPRLIHQYRTTSNTGALRFYERTGLIAMIEADLSEVEIQFITSIHGALRQQLGIIADRNHGNPASMKIQWRNLREDARRRFVGAKTYEQLRHELAQFWSVGGPNRELQSNWPRILPLLKERHWELTQDLALIALASYEGLKDAASTDDPEKEEE